jgi:hypothetical protein
MKRYPVHLQEPDCKSALFDPHHRAVYLDEVIEEFSGERDRNPERVAYRYLHSLTDCDKKPAHAQVHHHSRKITVLGGDNDLGRRRPPAEYPPFWLKVFDRLFAHGIDSGIRMDYMVIAVSGGA